MSGSHLQLDRIEHGIYALQMAQQAEREVYIRRIAKLEKELFSANHLVIHQGAEVVALREMIKKLEADARGPVGVVTGR